MYKEECLVEERQIYKEVEQLTYVESVVETLNAGADRIDQLEKKNKDQKKINIVLTVGLVVLLVAIMLLVIRGY